MKIKYNFFALLSLTFLLIIITMFVAKNSYSIDTSNNEYNFTSTETDADGNYVDNDNIKSAEWTSDDKSTADIKISYEKPINNILFLGTVCTNHGLTGAILQREVNYMASIGNVDVYLAAQQELGIWENGLSYLKNNAHKTYHYSLNKGESTNSIKTLLDSGSSVVGGRHAILLDFSNWIIDILENSSKEYGLIVLSFDDFLITNQVAASATGELYKNSNGEWIQDNDRVRELEVRMRKVAKIMKEYYDSGRVLWSIGASGITYNASTINDSDLYKVYIEYDADQVDNIENQRLYHDDGGYYYNNYPRTDSNSYRYVLPLVYPRSLSEYNHVLKSYNKQYVIDGITKNFNTTNIIKDETGPNMNDLSYVYFSFSGASLERKKRYIHNFIFSQRPYILQFAMFDPNTYLEVTNSDGTFKEIPSLIGEVSFNNNGKEMATGIYTDSDKSWNLSVPKTYYGYPERINELAGSMLANHELVIRDVLNEGLVPDSLDVEYKNENSEWISFKHIELDNGLGNSSEELIGDVVDLDNNRSYFINGYEVSKNDDNTYNVSVNILNKNNETGKALSINDNMRLVIHVKAEKSFAENLGIVNGLNTYGPKDTNKGEATIKTIYYKDGDPSNTSSGNADTIERIKYKSPKLTKYFKIHYNSDSNGYVTNNGEKVDINNEDAILGHNPNGSDNNEPFGEKANEGYKFSHWICDKNVTLTDGTLIRVGEKITSEQLKLVVVDDEMTFTAIHEKTEEVETPEENDNAADDVDDEKEENTDIAKTNVNANTMPYWSFVIPVLFSLIALFSLRKIRRSN